MDGNYFVILRTIHEQLHGCQCVKDKLPSCNECEALSKALIEIERVPRLRNISESIERSLLKETD